MSSDSPTNNPTRSNDGGPRVGRDFFINIFTNWSAISNSSLSGGVTTITDIVEEGVEKAQNSKNEWEENGSSFDQVYEASPCAQNENGGGIKPIKLPSNVGNLIENGGSESNDDRSSLSSLTNDIFPNVNLKEFFYFGKNEPKRQKKGRNQAGVWDEEACSIDDLSSTDNQGAKNRQLRTRSSSWYAAILRRKNQQPNQEPEPPSPVQFNDVGCIPPELQPPSTGTGLDNGLGMETNTNDSSTGFATFLYNEYMTYSRRRKISIMISLLVIFVFVVAIGAIAIAFSKGGARVETGEGETVTTKIGIEPVEERESFDQFDFFPNGIESGTSPTLALTPTPAAYLIIELPSSSPSLSLHSMSIDTESNELDTEPTMTPSPTTNLRVGSPTASPAPTSNDTDLSFLQNDGNDSAINESFPEPMPSPNSSMPTLFSHESEMSSDLPELDLGHEPSPFPSLLSSSSKMSDLSPQNFSDVTEAQTSSTILPDSELGSGSSSSATLPSTLSTSSTIESLIEQPSKDNETDESKTPSTGLPDVELGTRPSPMPTSFTTSLIPTLIDHESDDTSESMETPTISDVFPEFDFEASSLESTKAPSLTQAPTTYEPTTPANESSSASLPSISSSPHYSFETSTPSSPAMSNFDIITESSRLSTLQPTKRPTPRPTSRPTNRPSRRPSNRPTRNPTTRPTARPTRKPTVNPSGRPTKKPSLSPITLPGVPSVIVTPKSGLIQLKSAADTFINQSSRNRNYSNDPYLLVKGDLGSKSFVSFDISSILGHGVEAATLNLYCILREGESDYENIGLDDIQVAMLPRAGNWLQQTVTWDSPINMRHSFRIESFSVDGLTNRDGIIPEKELYEVDVTSAFSSGLMSGDSVGRPVYLTFMISSVSEGRVDFASREMDGGDLSPELLVILDSDDMDAVEASNATELPTEIPTPQPASAPTLSTEIPTTTPTNPPSKRPTAFPVKSPPTLFPTLEPNKSPTKEPTPKPTKKPTPTPTKTPIAFPSFTPSSMEPTMGPSIPPVTNPTSSPVASSTSPPTKASIATPSDHPIATTTEKPSLSRKSESTSSPTSKPTIAPSHSPVKPDTSVPSGAPITDEPTLRDDTPLPTPAPIQNITTSKPTSKPTPNPTSSKPTLDPTISPTLSPTSSPHASPTRPPTSPPTAPPTNQPTRTPTSRPTNDPTNKPSSKPTNQPSEAPTKEPTKDPTEEPTTNPTREPTQKPTNRPTSRPTNRPTNRPTKPPTEEPTKKPTMEPTPDPTPNPTEKPTPEPTPKPTPEPTPKPTREPTPEPTKEISD